MSYSLKSTKHKTNLKLRRYVRKSSWKIEHERLSIVRLNKVRLKVR